MLGDVAPVAVRGLLRALLEGQAEGTGGIPDPRNPGLDKLVAENRYTGPVGPVR